MTRCRPHLPLALALTFLLPGLIGCQESGPEEPGGRPGAQVQTGSGSGAQATEQDTVDLRSLGYDQGDPDAPVVVIEFSDFGCPYCGRFALSTYPELHEEFVETGRVRWKYVPFVMGMFPNGTEAARAAECAAEQDAFWPMHHRLYERQSQWKATDEAGALFADYAAAIELDTDRFASCYVEDRGRERTRAANLAADRLGIRATPTFIINGRILQGAAPLEQFRALLEELSR